MLGIVLLAACGGSSSLARRPPADPPRPAGPMCSELAVADEDARILQLTPREDGAQVPSFLRVEHAPPREALVARVHEVLGAHVALDFLEEGRVVRARSRDARAARAACALAQDQLARRRRELAQRTLGFLTEQLGWVYARMSEARSVADFYRREHGTARDREARRADIARQLEALGPASRRTARRRDTLTREALELDQADAEAADLFRAARMVGDLFAWLQARFAEEQRRRDRRLSLQSVCTQPAPCRAR